MDRFRPRQTQRDPNAPDPLNTLVAPPLPIPQPLPQPDPIPPPPPTAQVNVNVGNIQPQPEDQDDIIQEHWLKAYWRPACAWMYLIICFMDFVGFPILAMLQPVISKMFGVMVPYTPWVPLTLTQSGLVHMSFGAILGVSAWTRGTNK